MKNTPSRNKMVEENRDLLSEKLKYVGTLTKKQDRNPNTGYVDTNFIKENYLKQRFITPREAYKFMGFTDENFEETKKDLCKFTKEKYYSQAGNSIVVNVLEVIFKFIIGVWNEKNR
jgi:DNA (cytosine-5)-methyltransferase 1